MITFSTNGLLAIAFISLVTTIWAPVAVAQTSEQTAALSCMTLDEFRDHPDVLAFTEATESWATGGLDFGIYLNANLTLVASRAYDGDGAAMLVMATAKMLEAAGYDPGYAVPLLMHGGKPDGSWLEDLAVDIGRLHHRADFSDAEREMLASAQAWYYQLAADGRLQFLGDYGRIERTLYGGPVEHDWLTAEDYKRLAPQYRRQFFPDAVYNGVVAEFVLPGSMSCGVKSFDMSDRIVWRALVEEIYGRRQRGRRALAAG